MTTTISMLPIDLAKGSFQVCAIGAEGAVPYNRALSRLRLSTLLGRATDLYRGDGGLCHIASLGPGGSTNRWLAALVARKPKMVAAVALANKMARMIWAMTKKQEDYRMA